MVLGIPMDILFVDHSLVVHGKEIDGCGLLVCEVGSVVVAVALALIAQAPFELSTYMVIDFH